MLYPEAGVDELEGTGCISLRIGVFAVARLFGHRV